MVGIRFRVTDNLYMLLIGKKNKQTLDNGRIKQQNESQNEWEGHEVVVDVGVSFIFKDEMYLA